ncbi:hypothetical protein B0H14DRAFT_2670068 [Mycena olivaceomarginata]|nr:hypothetical protein B0H14DRAFT_2670068 [Mycena olivaceomarginata]
MLQILILVSSTTVLHMRTLTASFMENNVRRNISGKRHLERTIFIKRCLHGSKIFDPLMASCAHVHCIDYNEDVSCMNCIVSAESRVRWVCRGK